MGEDYTLPFSSWLTAKPQPVSLMPQPELRTFPYATQTMGIPDYSLVPQTDVSTGFGIRPGNASIATPLLTNAGDPLNTANGVGGNAITNYLRDLGFLATTDKNGMKTEGWGGLALGAAQGIGSLYMGMQQYNLAKEALANSKAQFERNFAAQRQTTNAALEDRQRARVASNAGAYQSVSDYMSQNGIR